MLYHICSNVGPRAAQSSLAMHRYGTLLSLAELQKRLQEKKQNYRQLILENYVVFTCSIASVGFPPSS